MTFIKMILAVMLIPTLAIVLMIVTLFTFALYTDIKRKLTNDKETSTRNLD